MKFEDILLKAPELIPLIFHAQQISKLNFTEHDKNHQWYKELKPRMSKLVGFHCDNQELATTEVYDKVYQFLITLMKI